MSAEAQTRVVRDIFQTVTGRYDRLNHILSFRRDIGWRRAAIRRMRFLRTHRLLDVASGTADLAIAAALENPGISVTGVDFSEPMLAAGRQKIRQRGLEGRIDLVPGDALALPFPDASFDVTAIAFGMRNIPDKLRALREMVRVTAPGGQVMVLEMTFAPAPAFRGMYRCYLTGVLPRLARLLARNPAAYFYLADSIMGFPSPPLLDQIMQKAGLREVKHYSLTFGATYLHVGRAPEQIERGHA